MKFELSILFFSGFVVFSVLSAEPHGLTTNNCECEYLLIFGGCLKWQAKDWQAVDDKVAGGSSQSNLLVSTEGDKATFKGYLTNDVSQNAGFASQEANKDVDLSKYDGISIWIAKGDGLKYTLTVNTDPPQNPRIASVVYAYDFVSSNSEEIQEYRVPFNLFLPTFKGQVQPHAKCLDIRNIKHWNLLIRGFFGIQTNTAFSITFDRIEAYRSPNSEARQSTLNGNTCSST